LSRVLWDQPARLYECAIAVQAGLAGASVVLMYLLMRWLIGATRAVALTAAVVASFFPTFLTNVGFAWAEPMLTFALLAALTSAVWLLRGIEERPCGPAFLLPRALLAGVACGYVVTVHNRAVLAAIAVVLITTRTLVRAGARRIAAIF